MERGRSFDWRRAAIAVVSAYALALQALLATLGSTHATPLRSDVPTAQCSPRGERPADEPRSGRPRGELCCILACAPVAAPVTAPSQVQAPYRSAAVAVAYHPVPSVAVATARLRPVGARAPPLLS
jgi:hypothetical protein